MTQRIRRPSRALSTRLSIPDWRDLNEDQPFYDSVTNQYCIVVATDATFASEEVIREGRPAALGKGVQNLYKFYNKDIGSGYGPAAVLQTARATKYHLDSRPCSTLRFLVCVNADLWDSIPHNPDRYLLPVPKAPIASVVNYNLSTLQSLLNSTAEKLDEYSGEISSHQDGNVSPDLNLAREAKRLRAVYPNLQKMLLFNNIEILPGGQVLQLSFTEDYTLDSIGIRGEGPPNNIARKLNIGFASFNRTFPMKFVRTRRYVATLKQMKEAFECPTPPPWYEFITEYSHKSAYVIDRFSNSRRGREIIGDVKKIFKDAKTVKTADEAREDQRALTAERKIKAADKRKEETNFVGNLLLSAGATKEVMDSISTSKEAYDKILNKVDMKYLAGVGMRMLTSETFQEDFNKALFEASLTVLDYIELNQVATECIDPSILADSGAFDDVDSSCPEDVTAAASKIAQLVADGHADNECMGRALEKVCPTPARLFGWRGHVENFLEKNTSTFLAYDRENLCPEPKKDGEDSPWEIPTIKFPTLPSITDVSVGIWDSFLKALRLTTDELVVGTIKEILALLLKNFENILCNWSDLRSFGKDRVQSIWEDSKQVPVDQFKSALYDWGIDAEALLNPAKPGTSPAEHITNFMDEVSQCLNPGELRAALSGEELGKNSEVIERAAGEHLVGLDPSDAMDVLAHSARNADLRNLDERTRFDVGQYVCDEINALKFEENFRNSYADRATPEEIERMLAAERRITAEKLRNLASLMNSPYDQMFTDCGVAATPPQDPSNSFMTNAAVDSQFAGIDNSFSQELSSFPRLLTVQESRLAQKGDPQYQFIFHNLSAFADGATDARIHEMTREQIAADETPDSTVVYSAVLPGLQRSLSNVTSSDETPTLSVIPAHPADMGHHGPVVDFKFVSFAGADSSTLGSMSYTTYAVAPADSPRPVPNINFYQKRYMAQIPMRIGSDGIDRDDISTVIVSSNNVSDFPVLDEGLIQHLEQNRSEFLKDSAGPLWRTPQQLMFSNYIASSIASTFDIPMSNLVLPGEPAANVVGRASDGASSLYINSLTTQLDLIASLIASSPLFEVHQESPLKGLFDIYLNQSITCPPGTQSHDNIMRTGYEKKQTELKYSQIIKEREAMIARNPDAELPKARPLQEASIPSILRSIVRIHVADIAVRNIFALSMFKGSSAIFKDNILLKYTKDYTIASLKEFINFNVAAFAKLGPSDDPVRNFEDQLIKSGLGNLEDVIVEVSSGVFEEIGKTMSREIPDESRPPLMQALGDSIGIAPVPESTLLGVGDAGVTFPFRPSTQRPVLDPTDPDAGAYLRNETHYWGASNSTMPMAPEHAQFAGRHAKRILLSSPRTSDPEHGDIVHDPNLGAPEDMDNWVRVQLGPKYDVPALNPRFQHLDGGHFVFEYFIEYEPLRGDDVPHNDIFLTMFEGNLQNWEYSTKQVENLEAFKEYFRSAVRVFVESEYLHQFRGIQGDDDEGAPIWLQSPIKGYAQAAHMDPSFPARLRRDGLAGDGSTPITPKAKEKLWRENNPDSDTPPDNVFTPGSDALAIAAAPSAGSTAIEIERVFFTPVISDLRVWDTVRRRRAENYRYVRGQLDAVAQFGQRKLSEYFASLKYGVRLTYVIPRNVDEVFPEMFVSDLPGQEWREWDTVVEGIANLNGVDPNDPDVDDHRFSDLAEIKKAYKIKIQTNMRPADERNEGDSTEIFPHQTMCTIPVLEETVDILTKDPGITIANFYGSEALRPGEDWSVEAGFGGWSRQRIFNPNITRLKERLIRNNPDFQILFDFALGSSRLTSLLAIYCMQTGTFTNKSLDSAFFRTKQSLIAAMFAAQPDLPIEEFYKYEDPNLAAVGGPQGLLKNQNRFASTSGQSGNAAAKTVPFIIKGLAEYQDPSYAYAAALDKIGLLPGGLGPTALAVAAPANMILGSPLPPVTNLGLSAYALGKLPGENVPYSERTSGAQGMPPPSAASESNKCGEVVPEEDE